MERIRAVAAHLAPAATTVQAPTAEQEPAVLSELLDDAAMAAFVRDGFVAFHLDDMPAEWHESVAADAQAASEASPGDQSAIWTALAPKMDAVVKAPRFQGVMRSLAGPDYMMTPSGHMHVSTTAGQSFRAPPPSPPLLPTPTNATRRRPQTRTARATESARTTARSSSSCTIPPRRSSRWGPPS